MPSNINSTNQTLQSIWHGAVTAAGGNPSKVRIGNIIKAVTVGKDNDEKIKYIINLLGKEEVIDKNLVPLAEKIVTWKKFGILDYDLRVKALIAFKTVEKGSDIVDRIFFKIQERMRSVYRFIFKHVKISPEYRQLILDKELCIAKATTPEELKKVFLIKKEIPLNDVEKRVNKWLARIEKEIAEPEQKAPLERKYPPLGLVDTVMFDKNTKGFVSVHGETTVFLDTEIIQVSTIIQSKKICENTLTVEYTSNGKAIIQQQAVRGCTAAASAMLIVDNGKEPKKNDLAQRNLGNDKDMCTDIKKAGLSSITLEISKDHLKTLKSCIEKNGSAIVSIEDPLAQGHVVVVDHISDDLQQVRLRDPYHGWEITVPADAFLLRFVSPNCASNIVQVQKQTSIQLSEHK